MQRRSPHPGAVRSGPADEALPEQILTPEWYWVCYRRWTVEFPNAEFGLFVIPEFAVAVDSAVADLVDKHGIVPLEDRHYLRSWLEGLFYAYFPTREAMRNELTDKEADWCKRRVKQLGEDLREELKRLYAYELHPDILALTHPDIRALERIVSHAQQQEELSGDRPTTKENASNDVVYLLSTAICWFWIQTHGGTANIPFDFSKRSPCFRFAQYVYTYVGAGGCTDRTIVERLRAAHRRITSLTHGPETEPTRRFSLMLAPQEPGHEPHPARPFPIGAQYMLRVLLDAGNVGFLDEPNDRIVTGTPDRPGRVVPGTLLDVWALVPRADRGRARPLDPHCGRSSLRHSRQRRP